jgi:molybdopterin-guanine dinucleotide biosynthesis protein A
VENVRAFVLAGGHSRRMGGGADKALLAHRDGFTQLERVARLAAKATGRRATIVGPTVRYANLLHSLPVENVLEDIIPNSGPLGGIHCALTHTDCDWNLIIAVDLPNLTAGFLRTLMAGAGEGIPAVVAAGQPLCGIYHRDRCLPEVSAALDRGMLKVTALAARLGAVEIAPESPQMLQNMNTTEDWERHMGSTGE